jgi:hypothetical protein
MGTVGICPVVQVRNWQRPNLLARLSPAFSSGQNSRNDATYEDDPPHGFGIFPRWADISFSDVHGWARRSSLPETAPEDEPSSARRLSRPHTASFHPQGTGED